MDCKEFRKEITAGSDNIEEMLEHRKTCQDCENWLMKEVSTAPEGISEEKWESLRKGMGREKEGKRMEKEGKRMEQDGEKSFLDYYLSGLKYGLVFGIAVVIGFSIIQNKKEAIEEEELRAKFSQDKLIASDSIEIASPSLDLKRD